MAYRWLRCCIFLLLFVVYCHMAIDFNETEIITIIENDNDTAVDLCLDCNITNLLDLNDTDIIDKTGEDQPIGIDVSKLKLDLGQIRLLIANASTLESDFDEKAGRDHGGSYILPVMKAVEYDNNTAPSVFTDQPVQVRVGLYVISLSGFDSSKMEYSMDIDFEMRWIDFRLANNYSKPIRIREKEIIDQIWRPDPYFVNSKNSYFHAVSFPNFRMRIRPDGLIVYNMRVTLLPACQMVFCRFPHDQQVCDLKISSIAYPKSFVSFSWLEQSIPVELNPAIALPELNIKTMKATVCEVEGKLIKSSCLRLAFYLERDGGRFIVEKYIPSTLAMMFAWVAPYVPYNYDEVRIITPITVLLTLVQLQRGDDQIPRVSYLTSMDLWFSAMKFFSVLSLVESLAVLALIKRSRAMEKHGKRTKSELERERFLARAKSLNKLYHSLDRGSRFLSPIVFVIFFVYYVLFVAQGCQNYCIADRSV